MFAKHNIKSVVLPSRKIFSYLPPLKDALGLRTPGIYSIPSECGRVYIGQSGRSIQTQIKEHSRLIRLARPDKSAVAEHSINHDQIINRQSVPKRRHIKFRRRGNYQEESIQHSEHGESLKSIISLEICFHPSKREINSELEESNSVKSPQSVLSPICVT
jgi:hypothetical protein